MDSSKLSCYFPNTVTILPLFLLSPLFFFYFIRLNSSHHVCPGYFQVRCFAFAPPRRGCTPGPVVIKRPRTRELIKDHCSGCVAILNCAGLRGTLVLYSWWDKNNSSYPQITFHRPRFLGAALNWICWPVKGEILPSAEMAQSSRLRSRVNTQCKCV